MVARLRSRIEAAVPFPLIGVVRIAAALGNRIGSRRMIKKMPARRGKLRDGPKGKIGSDADYNRLIGSSR
jgi:hypothetical protein